MGLDCVRRGNVSVWHSPTPLIETRTSPGPGSASVTSSIRYAASGPRSTAALISTALPWDRVPVRPQHSWSLCVSGQDRSGVHVHAVVGHQVCAHAKDVAAGQAERAPVVARIRHRHSGHEHVGVLLDLPQVVDLVPDTADRLRKVAKHHVERDFPVELRKIAEHRHDVVGHVPHHLLDVSAVQRVEHCAHDPLTRHRIDSVRLFAVVDDCRGVVHRASLWRAPVRWWPSIHPRYGPETMVDEPPRADYRPIMAGLSDDGEVLVRGPVVTPGYYH